MTVVIYSILLILAFFFTFVFVTAIGWQMIDLLLGEIFPIDAVGH